MRWFGLLLLSLSILAYTAPAQTMPSAVYSQLEQRLYLKKTRLFSSALFGAVHGTSFMHEDNRVFVVHHKSAMLIAVQESQVSESTDILMVLAIYQNKASRAWRKGLTLSPHAKGGEQTGDVELDPAQVAELEGKLLPLVWVALNSK